MQQISAYHAELPQYVNSNQGRDEAEDGGGRGGNAAAGGGEVIDLDDHHDE